ncbi:GntR family transcriptional regulator [Paracoccus albus]|uniref:GntR family transcriptional regulator n=1 Tax=Paracoccus albus TaxID=3017784 RepID=UPI0022F098CE|nr:GntR family transcriptional regulator [Paracoccus albus]WBU62141.1 GntR family transcriptional regulator [Paracoccus albus]
MSKNNKSNRTKAAGANPPYEAGVPLHAQVRERIRRHAMGGDLIDENGRLMPEPELVKHFGVSRVTVRQALAPLVAGGMFERTPGRGTFLRGNLSERWVGRLMGFQEIISEQGDSAVARVLDQGLIKATEEMRKVMDEAALWQLRRVRYADDAPIAIEHAYYPPDIGADLQDRDLAIVPIYRVFEEDMGLVIGEAKQDVAARLSLPEEDQLLSLGHQSALLSLRRITYSDDGRPLELLTAVYRSDVFSFSISLSRGV